ncbi:MAG: hypothetical protein NBV67_12965 [Tagaea sp.]|nr:hypothetical protein [Tagaea sp.]
MSEFKSRVEAMFETDMAAAKPIDAAKPDEVDEFDVRLAYLAGIARALDRHFPAVKGGAET